MKIDELDKYCKCCCCSGQLQWPFTWVQLPVKVNWPFPIWGNFITGQSNMGIAFLCDNCGNTVTLDQIKFAIEINGNIAAYHRLKWVNLQCTIED